MNIKYKIAYTLFFILSLSVAVIGIEVLAKSGGPCNGGIVLLLLVPTIIVCALLLLSPFAALLKKNSIHFKTELTISIIVFVIWTICIMLFTDSEAMMDVLYLVPFELFSIITIVMLTKLKESTIQ